jgi:signal transduction histidine kinase
VGFSLPPSLSELAQRGNFGLLGIQERVWSVNGTLEITSSPEKGTRLHVKIPINHKHPTQ